MKWIPNIKLHAYCKLQTVNCIALHRLTSVSAMCDVVVVVRTYAPASHDADDDDNEKMNAWVL